MYVVELGERKKQEREGEQRLIEEARCEFKFLIGPLCLAAMMYRDRLKSFS